MIDDDEEFDGPLQFKEDLGEHTLSNHIRLAFIWAAMERFLTEAEWANVKHKEFTEQHKKLAKSVVFHGPFLNAGECREGAVRRRGATVAYIPSWSDKEQPLWIVCLAN